MLKCYLYVHGSANLLSWILTNPLAHQNSSWHGGRRLSNCQWSPLRIWSEMFFRSRDFVTKKGGMHFLDGFSAWKSWTRYFGRKICLQGFPNLKKPERNLIPTNIRFTNRPRYIWGLYSNKLNLSDTLYIFDETFLCRSYTCGPTHAQAPVGVRRKSLYLAH